MRRIFTRATIRSSFARKSPKAKKRANGTIAYYSKKWIFQFERKDGDDMAIIRNNVVIGRRPAEPLEVEVPLDFFINSVQLSVKPTAGDTAMITFEVDGCASARTTQIYHIPTLLYEPGVTWSYQSNRKKRERKEAAKEPSNNKPPKKTLAKKEKSNRTRRGRSSETAKAHRG
eukprot:TRINITY_DN4368_c0_g1_i1.p1 TRINITY_DN4368_c0_g1~~TRINITY_DN4368_c0_g1_i1.p1  ORF type:complete len:173 (-),score=31.95 TRINITY_DN4368_c0_g1_i1:2-520(-)